MFPLYFALEYHRTDFPADYYGFTTADRIKYAPYAVDYMLYAKPLAYLGDLRFEDGTPFYNERELQHMDDVQRVTQVAFGVWIGVLAGQALIGVILWQTPLLLRGVLIGGSLLTLGLLSVGAAGVLLAWDRFFTLFHQLFFADGTWVFAYSDSLIRLYPPRFWQDSALNIGAFMAVGALVILGGCLRWRIDK